MGSNRINEFEVNIKGSKIMFVAAGQTTISKLAKDSNISLEDISINSAEWVKNAKFSIKYSEIEWLYTGGNSGYSYTINSECDIVDSLVTGGITAGGSNGKSDNAKYYMDNIKAPSYIATNRGIVESAYARIRNSEIDQVFVHGGDDSECTGLVNSTTIDMDNGKYEILVGKNNDEVVTTNDKVKYVKISRSADYTISDDAINILGDKFITK
jgi:hypothetical protein